MFTGIIEEIGTIEKVSQISGGMSLTIRAKKVMEDIAVNDSICIDGVCLTVTKKENGAFWADAVGATLEKTTFNKIKADTFMNLERSVRLNDRLGGHFVQEGHVNGVGTISEIKNLGENYLVKIIVPEELERYLIKEGSIAINGISLTIADLDRNEISISVIPPTSRSYDQRNGQARKPPHIQSNDTDVLEKAIRLHSFSRQGKMLIPVR